MDAVSPELNYALTKLNVADCFIFHEENSKRICRGNKREIERLNREKAELISINKSLKKINPDNEVLTSNEELIRETEESIIKLQQENELLDLQIAKLDIDKKKIGKKNKVIKLYPPEKQQKYTNKKARKYKHAFFK